MGAGFDRHLPAPGLGVRCLVGLQELRAVSARLRSSASFFLVCTPLLEAALFPSFYTPRFFPGVRCLVVQRLVFFFLYFAAGMGAKDQSYTCSSARIVNAWEGRDAVRFLPIVFQGLPRSYPATGRVDKKFVAPGHVWFSSLCVLLVFCFDFRFARVFPQESFFGFADLALFAAADLISRVWIFAFSCVTFGA